MSAKLRNYIKEWVKVIGEHTEDDNAQETYYDPKTGEIAAQINEWDLYFQFERFLPQIIPGRDPPKLKGKQRGTWKAYDHVFDLDNSYDNICDMIGHTTAAGEFTNKRVFIFRKDVRFFKRPKVAQMLKEKFEKVYIIWETVSSIDKYRASLARKEKPRRRPTKRKRQSPKQHSSKKLKPSRLNLRAVISVSDSETEEEMDWTTIGAKPPVVTEAKEVDGKSTENTERVRNRNQSQRSKNKRQRDDEVAGMYKKLQRPYQRLSEQMENICQQIGDMKQIMKRLTDSINSITRK